MKSMWQFWVLFVLILVFAFSTTAQFHNSQVAACERGNVVRSVVYDAVNTAGKTGKHGRANYKADIAKLRAVKHSDHEGVIDCQAAIPQPWYVP